MVVYHRGWQSITGEGGLSQGMVVYHRGWWSITGDGGLSQGMGVYHRGWWSLTFAVERFAFSLCNIFNMPVVMVTILLLHGC